MPLSKSLSPEAVSRIKNVLPHMQSLIPRDFNLEIVILGVYNSMVLVSSPAKVLTTLEISIPSVILESLKHADKSLVPKEWHCNASLHIDRNFKESNFSMTKSTREKRRIRGGNENERRGGIYFWTGTCGPLLELANSSVRSSVSPLHFCFHFTFFSSPQPYHPHLHPSNP